MMKKLLFILISLLCIGCSKEDSMVDVPYIVASGYYVNNSTSSLKELVIYNATEWGMFASNYYPNLCVPKYIDFNRNFVIAVQQKVIDEIQEIKPVSLKYGNSSLHFTYTIKRGEKLSSGTTAPGPAIMLVVSKEYANGEVIFHQM